MVEGREKEREREREGERKLKSFQNEYTLPVLHPLIHESKALVTYNALKVPRSEHYCWKD
jgi:hypothetical protein